MITGLNNGEVTETTIEYRAEIEGNPLEPVDDQNFSLSSWVEVNGKVVYDSRVINEEYAKALYGDAAKNRPISYIFVSSEGLRMELGNYGFHKQNKTIYSTPDLAQNSLTNTNPTKALADAKEQITKKLKEYSKSASVMGFITTDVLTPELTDGAWAKWVVYFVAGGIATHYINKMNKEIDGIMRRAGGPQGANIHYKPKSQVPTLVTLVATVQ